MKPGEGPAYNPLTTVKTLIVEAVSNGRLIAVIEGAVWPTIGSAIEVPNPEGGLSRDVKVLAVRLQLDPFSQRAIILVDVDTAEAGEWIDRLFQESDV